MMELIKDLLGFLVERKALDGTHYLGAIVVWILIVLTEGSAVAPFIYTLF